MSALERALEHIARFDRTGDLRELEAGIADYRKLAARYDNPLLLADLGNALSRRYSELRQEPDILEAIDLHRRAVAALAGRPEQAEAQAQLATVLGNHQKFTGQHLTEILELYAAALRGQLQDRPLVLANYGMFLQSAYVSTGDRAHLIHGIEALRECVNTTDPASDTYLWRVAKLGSTLIPMASDPGYAAELKAAVHTVRERYDEAPEVVKREIQILLHAVWNPDDIDEVPAEVWELFQNPRLTEQFRSIAEEDYSGRLGRSRYLAGVASLLIEDVRRSGRLDRADQAAEMIRRAVAGAPAGSPELGLLLGALGAVLGLRMTFSGTVSDLDEMITALRRGVDLVPADDPNRGMYRSDLGGALGLKFQVGGGDPAVLEEAIASYQRALAESPDHPERAKALTGLGAAFVWRFELTGQLADLDKAIEHHRAAVAATARDHHDYALYLANLGGALHGRFAVTRQGPDADEGVDALRKAVAAVEATSPYRPGYLSSLGGMLTERYQRTGQTAALDEAIGHLREAARTVQPRNLALPIIFNNLGKALTQTGQHEDEAIEAFRRARSAAPAGSATHVIATMNLGGNLVIRASSADDGSPQMLSALLEELVRQPRQRRSLRDLLPRGRKSDEETPDLDEAVALLEEVTKSRRPVGPAAYSGLGLALQLRYRMTGKPKALVKALRTMRAAVAATNAGDPRSSAARYYLAEVLADQWELTANDAARDEALAWYRRAAEVETASADWRATVGKRWGEFAMDAGMAAEAADGFAAAIGMLDEAAWRGLGRDDQERVLGDYEGLARDAAAAAIRAGDAERALELLEQGRGVMLAQIIDSRVSHDLLREAAPELAGRLAAVQDSLDRAERVLDFPGSGDDIDWPRHVDRLYTLARHRSDILAEIRRLPDFTDFLRPPSCQGLLKAAAEGPVVVVNASQYGCDALILPAARVRVLPLSFTAPEASRQARRLADAVRAKAVDQVGACLDWLWDNVTGPVLDSLGPVQRIWWCPTGPLTLMPLHAAGTALDSAISSYTPTLRALLHARDHAAPKMARKVLLVGVANVPGEAPLTGVTRELETVRGRIPGADELTDADATHDRVLAALEESAWAHFACHATQELGDPSRARLLLSDRPLTVRELAARRLDQAEFAFLSACETSRGGDVLTDEAISIAATIQLAGFPQVIGTLWPASDIHAPTVAGDVYTMLTADGTRELHPGAAATALHDAVRSLRKRRPDLPIFWAPYVHMGPLRTAEAPLTGAAAATAR